MYKIVYFLFITFYFFQIPILYAQEIQFTESEKEWIKQHPIIEFGYAPNWEPYEIYSNNEYTGIVNDYITKIELATGIEMQPIPNMTWEKSIIGLRDGSIKMVPSCAITAERKKYLNFTEAYINDPLVIITRKDYEFIGNLNDLIDKTVAVPKGYYQSELLKKDYPNIKLSEQNNVRASLEALSYGEVDAFIGNLGVVSYYINNKGFTNLKIAAPTLYKDIGIAFAFTKDWTIFRDIVQKILNEISIKERSAIRKNWISVRYEHGVSWQKIALWVGATILIFLIILYILWWWNRTLKREIKFRRITEKRLNNSISRIEQQNKEKEVLIQEIHHRVKNNLQVIMSMIRLQSSSSKNSEVISSLNQATDRIRSISLIHEKIYSSNDLGNIMIIDYVNSLGDEIIKNLSSTPIRLTVNSNIQNLNLKSIVPLALILNELITNSLKFGFLETVNPEIKINFESKTLLKMSYFDNGIWFDNPKSDNFGTSLIEIFTEQLEGTFILNKSKLGTEYIFEFDLLD